LRKDLICNEFIGVNPDSWVRKKACLYDNFYAFGRGDEDWRGVSRAVMICVIPAP